MVKLNNKNNMETKNNIGTPFGHKSRLPENGLSGFNFIEEPSLQEEITKTLGTQERALSKKNAKITADIKKAMNEGGYL